MVSLKPVKPPHEHSRFPRLLGFALAGIVLLGLLAKSSRSPSVDSVQQVNVLSKQSSGTAASLSSSHRILCYGDSLTAGSSGMEKYPYAPFLEAKLQKQQHSYAAKVVWIGLPGWTTERMMQQIDNAQTGLQGALLRYKQQPATSSLSSAPSVPFSLVILLAGTNDLRLALRQGSVENAKKKILSNLYKLHDACYRNGVPRTIAIAIPPSAWQEAEPEAAELAASINTSLRSFCFKHPQCTFVDFPFPYQRNDPNWFHDGLHFTEHGYQVLGESLAPAVTQILHSLAEGST